MKTILVKAWRGGLERLNLGEWFCSWILKGMGYGIEYMTEEPTRREPLIMIGSGVYHAYINWILQRAPAVHIWGAGNGEVLKKPVNIPGACGRIKVYALRGPLTAIMSNANGDFPILDAAFVLPKVYPLTREPSDEVLYVPHHAEREQAPEYYKEVGADDWMDVILSEEEAPVAMQRIVNAKFVLTGTLHTMLACIAYGVPCACCAPALRNMPLKWVDSFAAIGHEMPPRVQSVEEGVTWYGKEGLTPPDPTALIAAFPHFLAEEQ